MIFEAVTFLLELLQAVKWIYCEGDKCSPWNPTLPCGGSCWDGKNGTSQLPKPSTIPDLSELKDGVVGL